MQWFFVPGPMPGLNEIIEAKGDRYGGAYSRYNKMKKMWHHQVSASAWMQKVQPVECGYFTYVCMEATKRRDPSNVTAGAIKLIEDGLQECDILKGDGWKQVLGIASYWAIDKVDPGVHVLISETGTLSMEQSLLIIERGQDG